MQEKKEPLAVQTSDSDNSVITDNSNTAKKKSSSSKKKHAFATIIYEESAPADWRQTLDNLHMEVLVSPLHDKDVNPDGEIKKAHRHVLLMFPSPRSEKQAKEIFDQIGGVGMETVQTTRGYARYLCHLDNPEKYQYDKSEVIAFGGADYSAIITLPGDTDETLREIFKFIRENEIISFAKFIDIAADNNPDWFRIATAQRSYVIDKYIKSFAWELEYRDADDQYKKTY